MRSSENGTPPMHFLTPHVEISMADNDSFKVSAEIEWNEKAVFQCTMNTLFGFNFTILLPTARASADEPKFRP